MKGGKADWADGSPWVATGGVRPRCACLWLLWVGVSSACDTGTAVVSDGGQIVQSSSGVDGGGVGPRVACAVVNGSVVCDPCPEGYEAMGEARCRDIDECAVDNGGCDPLTTCMNLAGGHECGPCPEGYRGHGSSGCDDIDECARMYGPGCDPRVVCENTAGSFRCGACPPGYEGDGEQGCQDTDECAVDNGGCGSGVVCINNQGGFSCGPCPEGQRGDAMGACQDIEGCAIGHGGCDPGVTCSDGPDGAVCGPCPEGTRGSGDTACMPERSCDTDNGGCDPSRPCTALPNAAVRCGACPGGFTDDGAQGCQPLALSLALDGVGLALAPAFSPEETDYRVFSPRLSAPELTVGIDHPLGTSVVTGDEVPVVVVAGEGEPLHSELSLVLEPGENRLSFAVVVAGSGQRRDYDLVIDRAASLRPAAYLKAPNCDAEDGFGTAVAADADAIAVGAPGEAGDGTAPENNAAPGAGAVYVYRRGADGVFGFEAYLKPEGVPEAGDRFGAAVAVEAGRIAVGAPGESAGRGAVYVFERGDDGAWTQRAVLVRGAGFAGDGFGSSVALRGTELLVGAPGAVVGEFLVGAAVPFTRGASGWVRAAEELPPPEDSLSDSAWGSAVGLGPGVFVVAGPEGMRTYTGQAGAFREDASQLPFGLVGLSLIGTDAVLGFGSGAQKYLRIDGVRWTSASVALTPPSVAPGDAYGAAIAGSAPGRAIVIGAPQEDGGARQVDGDPADKSAPDAGAAFVFRNSTYESLGYLKAFNADPADRFGSAVAVSGADVVVGAPGEAGQLGGVHRDPDRVTDGNPAPGAGAVYIFR